MRFKERFKKIIEAYEKHYWNNYWNKTNVIYAARHDWLNGYTISMILKLDSKKSNQTIYDFFFPMIKQWNLNTDDKKALWAFRWVRDKIKYIGDFKKTKRYEEWQTAYETFTDKSGDCEDGAILQYKICRIFGISAYKLKIKVGKVKYNNKLAGHAYLVYLTRGNNQWAKEWYILDWTYAPGNSLKNFKNKPIRKIKMYNPPEQYALGNPLRWAFNEEFEWIQLDWRLPFKRLVEDIEI